MDGSPWTQEIRMHKTPAPSYQLKIVNGDRDGSNRVTSAKIEINGLTIVSPPEINEGVEMLTRKIQLQNENEIKVTVDGLAKSISTSSSNRLVAITQQFKRLALTN